MPGREARSTGSMAKCASRASIRTPDLQIPAGADAERAKKLLEKAESTCLVANSLSSERHLTMEVVVAG